MFVRANRPYNKDGKSYVDVRDYIVKKCIKKREALVIDCLGSRTIIPPERLKSYKKLTNQKFSSQYGGQSYYLYSYELNPETKEEEEKRYLL